MTLRSSPNPRRNSNGYHHSTSASKCLITHRWKVRLQALALLALLVIPGNMVTLILYQTQPDPRSSNSTDAENNSSFSKFVSTDDCIDDSEDYEMKQKPIEEIISNQTEDLNTTFDSANCYESTSINSLLDKISFWIEGVSVVTVASFGLLGNLLTVLVIANLENSSRSPFNTILVSLVIMDTFLLVFFLVDSAYLSAFKAPEPVWYKIGFPYLWHPIKNVVTSGCIYMVVAVAAERFHAICHPLKYKPKPIFYLSLVVLVSFLINIPKFLEFESVVKKKNNCTEEVRSYTTSRLNEDPYFVVFTSFHEVGVNGFLPLMTLCYLNYNIYVKIRNSAEIKNRHVGRANVNSSMEGGNSRSLRCLTNSSSTHHHQHHHHHQQRRLTNIRQNDSFKAEIEKADQTQKIDVIPQNGDEKGQIRNGNQDADKLIKLDTQTSPSQDVSKEMNDNNTGSKMKINDNNKGSKNKSVSTEEARPWKSNGLISRKMRMKSSSHQGHNGRPRRLSATTKSLPSKTNRTPSRAVVGSSFIAVAKSPSGVSQLNGTSNNGIVSGSSRKSSGTSNNGNASDKKHFQSRRDKSTGILLGIIVVFIFCHVLRLGIQVYEIFSPTHGLEEFYHNCYKQGRLHVPAALFVLGNINHLVLVINSSVNFLIYCCMARRFREAFVGLLHKAAQAFGSAFKVGIRQQTNVQEEFQMTDIKTV